MELNDYQKKAKEYGNYPENMGPYFISLAISSKTGELADIIMHMISDDEGKMTAETLRDISYNIGDLLWYISNLANDMGITLEELALLNLQKMKYISEQNDKEQESENDSE